MQGSWCNCLHSTWSAWYWSGADRVIRRKRDSSHSGHWSDILFRHGGSLVGNGPPWQSGSDRSNPADRFVAGQSGTELALARYIGKPAPAPPSLTAVEAVEAELDALITAIDREVPAGAVEAALAGLASGGKGLALLAEQDLGLGRHHRAISRLRRAVRLLTRLERRLRSPAVRSMAGVALANALAVQTGHAARDLRTLRSFSSTTGRHARLARMMRW